MRTSLILAFAVALAFSGETLAQPKGRPMTVEDMIRLRSPKGLKASPTDDFVAFSVASRDLDSNSGRSTLHVMELDSGKMRSLSAGGKSESEPTFSPDGKTLAFTSNATGAPQIWTVGLAEGAPKQVTSLSTGCTTARFTPDGKHLLCVSHVFAECADDACNKALNEAAESNPVKARIFETLMYRHWDSWKDGGVDHIMAIDLQTGGVRDLMFGDTWGLTGGWDVTPDGKWLVYTTKNPEKEELNTNHEVARVPLALTGAPATQPVQRELLTHNPALDQNPVVSPDGKWILYTSHQRPGFESDLFRLTLMPVDGGTPSYLGAELDQWVVEYGFFQDSKRIWFAIHDQGRISVYITTVGAETPKKVLGGASHSLITLDNEGERFALVRQTLAQAAEIWSFPVKGGKGTKLTSLNDWMAKELQLATVEDFWWEGAGGTKVHGFLLFGPGTSKEKKNPFVMVIHGGPQGMWEDSFHPRWNAQMFAAPGYVVLVPNPRGSSGYGQQFVDEVSRDWGGRVYEDLMRGVDALVAKGWIDEGRMCAGGGSFGGYMTNWILANNTRFACLFSHAGVFDLRSMYGTTEELWFPEWEYGGMPWNSDDYEKWSPSTRIANFKTPTLVIHGAYDFRVPESQAMQLFTALQRMGVPSKFLYFPDETHFVVKPKNSKLWYDTVHGWLRQYLLK